MGIFYVLFVILIVFFFYLLALIYLTHFYYSHFCTLIVALAAVFLLICFSFISIDNNVLTVSVNDNNPVKLQHVLQK